MIGNDIIDLSISKVGTGTRKMRYLQKIFREEEIEFITNSTNEDLIIWLMWSIKESVYKIAVRQEKKIRYAPKSIFCQSIIQLQNDSFQSNVLYNGSTFTSISTLKVDCIHTIAFDDQINYHQIKSSTFDFNNFEDRSMSLDIQVIDELIRTKNNPKGEFIIKRDRWRIPHVYQGNKEIAVLSLSHHGKFSGFSLAFNDSWMSN